MAGEGLKQDLDSVGLSPRSTLYPFSCQLNL